ncbi:MAG TPA: methionyl-tRNA formyltransferase, partial [Gemmatimonadaceae bacterium]
MTALPAIALFGDGPWAASSLELLAAEGYPIVGVIERVSPSDATLGDVARALRVPLLRPANAGAPAFAAELAALAPDLGLSISYNQILRRSVLSLPRLGVVNFHAGMLPRYRGRNVINWAIINGEEEIGLTAHLVDEGIDTGAIVLQRALPIGWTDNYGDVLRRVVAAFPALVVDTVRLVASGRATPTPQDESAATYFGGRENGDEWLDWSDTSRHLHDKIRGISRPGPGARTMLGDSELVIWRAYYDPSWPSYTATPGQVVGRCADGAAIVKTGDSTIQVSEVQRAGEESGAPSWRIGTRLGVNLAECLRAMNARLSALE